MQISAWSSMKMTLYVLRWPWKPRSVALVYIAPLSKAHINFTVEITSKLDKQHFFWDTLHKLSSAKTCLHSICSIVQCSTKYVLIHNWPWNWLIAPSLWRVCCHILCNNRFCCGLIFWRQIFEVASDLVLDPWKKFSNSCIHPITL